MISGLLVAKGPLKTTQAFPFATYFSRGRVKTTWTEFFDILLTDFSDRFFERFIDKFFDGFFGQIFDRFFVRFVDIFFWKTFDRFFGQIFGQFWEKLGFQIHQKGKFAKKVKNPCCIYFLKYQYTLSPIHYKKCPPSKKKQAHVCCPTPIQKNWLYSFCGGSRLKSERFHGYLRQTAIFHFCKKSTEVYGNFRNVILSLFPSICMND